MVAPGEETAQDKERPNGKGMCKGMDNVKGKGGRGRGREKVQGLQKLRLPSKKCGVYLYNVQGRPMDPTLRLRLQKLLSATAVLPSLLLMCGFRLELTSWIQG